MKQQLQITGRYTELKDEIFNRIDTDDAEFVHMLRYKEQVASGVTRDIVHLGLVRDNKVRWVFYNNTYQVTEQELAMLSMIVPVTDRRRK